MPITKDGNGKIIYSPAAKERLFDETAAVTDTDFAVIDAINVLKQIKFNVNPLTTDPGVLTLQCDISGDTTLNLTQFSGGGNSFGIVQTPAGTSPTASTQTDTLNLTASDSAITITGNSGTNTIDFTLPAASVTGKALTGFSSGAGTVSAADSILTAINKLDGNIAGKQASGNYITALIGDGTASGPGSAAFTLATVNGNVGSFGSATAVATLTANAKGLITAAGSTTIQIAESQVTNLVTDLAAKQSTTLTNAHILVGNVSNVATDVAVTGDITITNAGVTAIGSNKAANSQLAQMAAHTFKGNNTGSTANALDLTATQLTAELNVFVGDSGSGGTKGLVIAPATGDATKYLRGDATWATVSSGSSTMTVLNKAANYTVTTTDFSNMSFILCDSTSGAFNLTLPTPSTLAGQRITIKDQLGKFSLNNVTLVRAGSEKIENVAASKILQSNYGATVITTDGTDWYIL